MTEPWPLPDFLRALMDFRRNFRNFLLMMMEAETLRRPQEMVLCRRDLNPKLSLFAAAHLKARQLAASDSQFVPGGVRAAIYP